MAEALQMVFRNGDGTLATITEPNFDPAVTPERVASFMDLLVRSAAFSRGDVQLYTKVVSAGIVETIRRPLFERSDTPA